MPENNVVARQRLADLGRLIDAHEQFYGAIAAHRTAGGRLPRPVVDFVVDEWGPFARGWQDAQGSLSMRVRPVADRPGEWTTVVDPGYTEPPLDWMNQVARETTAGLARVRATASRAGVAVPPIGAASPHTALLAMRTAVANSGLVRR